MTGPAPLIASLLCTALPLAAAPLEVRVADAAGKPIAGVVVFVESPEARSAIRPVAGTEIAQVGKQFVPPVTIVPVGSAINFPNRDTVRHHVYSFSPVKPFEIKLYVGTPASPVVFDKPGIAVLGCNIHDNMVAWVVIVDTPYYGQTGADGKLTLPNLPTGNYRLRTWHAGLPVGAAPSDQALVMGSGAQQAAVTLAGLRP
ncbi:methylamine utilization protein [Aquincola sp. S2]|uniref:Methylamine utilization protein n=1 Tax=Pseudaquabacterium terrae TaxID=2732868 RepID=A0ABX2EC12_9BURK|nr:methylamine utilization protein [Aquabacterium terrae]NRF66322.1 methylamine utilization protein [Aquabacterium terrae]